jgi:hypothetical protein
VPADRPASGRTSRSDRVVLRFVQFRAWKEVYPFSDFILLQLPSILVSETIIVPLDQLDINVDSSLNDGMCVCTKILYNLIFIAKALAETCINTYSTTWKIDVYIHLYITIVELLETDWYRDCKYSLLGKRLSILTSPGTMCETGLLLVTVVISAKVITLKFLDV